MAIKLATYGRGGNPGVRHMPSIRVYNHQKLPKSRCVKSLALTLSSTRRHYLFTVNNRAVDT